MKSLGIYYQLWCFNTALDMSTQAVQGGTRVYCNDVKKKYSTGERLHIRKT